jgi:hypothetical protein
MIAIAPRHKIAVDTIGLAVSDEGDERLVRAEILWPYRLGFVDGETASGVARAIIGLPVNFRVSIKKPLPSPQTISLPSWMMPSRSIRAPNPAERRRSTDPASRRPARIRPKTCARDRRSTTMLSIPLSASKWERRSPAGPPPIIATCVRTACPQKPHSIGSAIPFRARRGP